MNYVKTHWHALAVGAVVGYFLARNGGLGGAVSSVRSKVGV